MSFLPVIGHACHTRLSWSPLAVAVHLLLLTRRILFVCDHRECQADVDNPATVFRAKFFLKQALFLVLFAVFVVVFLVGKRGGNDGRVHHAINSMSALYSVCFVLLVQSNAAIWDCSSSARGTFQLDEFPDITCYQDVWVIVAAFSAVSLLCYVIIIPATLLRKLTAAKKDGTLVEPEMKAKFGWMFLRYKYHACTYYEFAMMARKALLICVGMFFSADARTVLGLSILVLLGALALQYKLRPYADHELDHSDEDSHDRSQWTDADKLDAAGLACEILSVCFALYFTATTNTGEVAEHGWLDYVVATLALIVSVVPLILAVGATMRARKAQGNAQNDKEKDEKMDETEEEAEVKVEANPVATTE